MIALLFVLGVTAVKDGYDDILRHRSDNTINTRKTRVVQNDGSLKDISWRDVRVGNIVKMENNEQIPADLLLLSSSESSGLCFIDTADLDGETNLKYRQALVQTQDLEHDCARLIAFNGEIQCEPPNDRLHRFKGTLYYQGEKFALTNDNILLRGCTIRNSQWATGIVIFTGHDTKLMKNAGRTVYKRTRLEILANRFLLGIFLILFIFLVIAAVLGFFFESSKVGQNFKDSYGLWMDIPDLNPTKIGAIQFFSYLILIQTLIPISLYVTFEIIRIMISRIYINYDPEMYHPETDTPACARTTTLNEELGQIEYIFSDKTGTLTQNIMTFNKCSVGGKSYGDARDPQSGRIVEVTQKNAYKFRVHFESHEPDYFQRHFHFYDKTLLEDLQQRTSEDIHEFFLLLCLCHTINAEIEDGELVYKAQSPDEAALVGAARNFGYVYIGRTQESITVRILGEEKTFDMLCILDFDNVRKRMSVVVRDPVTRKIKLYCKGADTSIMENLASGTKTDHVSATQAHLGEFAGSGLRTLCCAVRDIEDFQWQQWYNQYHRASTSMEGDREGMVFECYMQVEKEMTLVGATAVEDKLQTGVPETIFNLADAGIKIWVLTGDKQETAINIGYSCNMLRDTMDEFIVDADDFVAVERQLISMKESIDRMEEENRIHQQQIQPNRFGLRPLPSTESNFALIINGHSLIHALDDRLEELFLSVATRCQAVICCRVAPLQKGAVVDLVKRKKKALTLAIGDGANDV